MIERKNEILITGEICTELANKVQQEIEALVSNGAKKITFKVNSEGGSVVAGLQIYDAITALSDIETECFIFGVCGSAATYISCACDKVIISPNATFMIHKCEGGLYGTIEEIQNDLIYFDQLQNQVLAIYAVRTGRTIDDIYNEIETAKYYNAEQALAQNWVDEIAGNAVQLSLPLTNKMNDEDEKEVEEIPTENNTPIFSLKNIIRKCKDLITVKNADEEKIDYTAKIAELENKLEIEHKQKLANVEELKNRIAELEFEKANLNNTIENEVTKRIASLGYQNDELPIPVNEISKIDFRKIVNEQGLNAALNMLNY